MASKSIDNALYNILSNIFKIAVVSIVSFAITGVLVRELGEELYGVIPLFNSFNRYVGLVTIVLSASVGRFVSLSYFKEDIHGANKYYSSAFFGIIFIILVIFLVFYLFSSNLDLLFLYPEAHADEIRWFFILSVAAFLLTTLLSVLNVPAFITHSFYFTDIIASLSKIVQFCFLLVFLKEISVIVFGFSLITSAVFSIFLSYIISVRLLPKLKINIKNASGTKLKDMGGMGFNSLLNSIGVLLYTSSDIIIANILLGSIESGHYGIVVQCGMIVTMLGGGITSLLAPVIVRLIANDKRKELISCIVRFTKLICLFSAFPFVIFFVFSKPILNYWLGYGFESLYLLNILVVGNLLLHQTTSLTFTYFNMMNKLRVPAIMTFVTGLLNIFVSVILVTYTNLGVYGVAIGTLISVLFKNIVFNVIYASRLLDISPVLIWVSILKGVFWPILFGGLMSFFLSSLIIDTVVKLLGCVAALMFAYLLGSIFFQLNTEDKKLLLSIMKLDKFKWKKV